MCRERPGCFISGYFGSESSRRLPTRNRQDSSATTRLCPGRRVAVLIVQVGENRIRKIPRAGERCGSGLHLTLAYRQRLRSSDSAISARPP